MANPLKSHVFTCSPCLRLNKTPVYCPFFHEIWYIAIFNLKPVTFLGTTRRPIPLLNFLRDVPTTRICPLSPTNPWRNISFLRLRDHFGYFPLFDKASLFRLMSRPEVIYLFGVRSLDFLFLVGYIAPRAYTPKLRYPVFTMSIYRSSSRAVHQNDRLLHVLK